MSTASSPSAGPIFDRVISIISILSSILSSISSLSSEQLGGEFTTTYPVYSINYIAVSDLNAATLTGSALSGPVASGYFKALVPESLVSVVTPAIVS